MRTESGTAKPIPDFPEYLIDRDGTVITARNGAIRRTSKTRHGSAKVTLYHEGRPYTKSLALLVAKTHLYNNFDPDIFDTPIHLDHDLTNNHVDNLAWRPRWFAVKYQKQYYNPEYRNNRVHIEDVDTGDVYDSLMDVCMKHGLLYMDVIQSCTRGTDVPPRWKKFRFLD